MKGKRYKLGILWDVGILTEITISEAEEEMIERHGSEYILLKYYLKGNEEAKPESFQVWDENDEPLFPVESKEAVPA